MLWRLWRSRRKALRPIIIANVSYVVASLELGTGHAYCVLAPRNCTSQLSSWRTYLRYPPNVLISVLLCEAQVLVEPKAHIVAVETVRGETEMQKVLL